MKALLVIDVQNDFLPGGALAVPEGDQVIPVINRMMGEFPLVVASQDWHPPGHHSFASTHGKQVGEVLEGQVMWPDHCVQGSQGAAFSEQLDQKGIHHIVHKGCDLTIDSYSAFYDNGHLKSTGLAEYLREQGVDEVVVVGLATDYCVKFTVLDAVQEGFKVSVVKAGCRGVELSQGDVAAAWQQMEAVGAVLV